MTNNSVKLIKPAWNNTLGLLANMLDEKKTVEFLEELSRGYYLAKDKYLPNDYNPHIDDILIMGHILQETDYFHMDITDVIDNTANVELSMDSINPLVDEAAKEWLRFKIMAIQFGGGYLMPELENITEDATSFPHLRELLGKKEVNGWEYHTIYLHLKSIHYQYKPKTL